MRGIRLPQAALGLVAALMGGHVLAHETGKHAKPSAYDAASAEQKPFGFAGDPLGATRTIRVDMRDTMRFAPARLKVRRGETVRFVVRNAGRTIHALVIGTRDELAQHAELMRKFPGMEHDEPYMAHVAPGRTEEIVWTFNRTGQFEYACLIPGHFEAGMVGRIDVIDSPVAAAPARAAVQEQTAVDPSPATPVQPGRESR